MISRDTIETIAAIAVENGIEPAALLAICHVESGGKVFAKVDGRFEPLIRFEGHYFDRRLSGAKRQRARTLGLASPKAGVVANPSSQTKRWELLHRAEAIDRLAARESVSWGLGQVMGAHWAWLGYDSVDELVSEARDGAAGQVRLMLRYIRKAGLEPTVSARDWAAFARGYNGPAFRRYRYDTKIAAAYKRYVKSEFTAVPPPDKGSMLRTGDRGPAVAELQRKLTALGYPLRIDGAFGPATDEAVRRFQANHGFTPSGIGDDATLAELDHSLPLSGGISGLWRLIRRLLAGR